MLDAHGGRGADRSGRDGKSYAVGAFAHARGDLTGGWVSAFAVSQVATQVSADDGLARTRNIATWLATQGRLDTPRRSSTYRAEDEWALVSTDVVVVDEASMVATAKLDEIRTGSTPRAPG